MALSHHRAGGMSDMLEPAIEGPPSPESIRAFSNQMRWASTMDKQQQQQQQLGRQSRQSHQTTSSASSSLRSLTLAERPPWDTGADAAPSLSRRSSGRSTTSIQPRERHDGGYIFGKNIFGKRGKLRRESSAQSSNSSLYSHEASAHEIGTAVSSPMPALSPTSSHGLSGNASREALIPHFFNRRRAHKATAAGDDADGTRRKLQISGPYNFQHLTHADKEQVSSTVSTGSASSSQRASRAVGLDDVTAATGGDSSRSSLASRASRDLQTGNLHFPNFSSEALPVGEDGVLASVPRRFPMRPHASTVSAAFPPRMSLVHTRSQDQLRLAPPRPPRSPIEPSSMFCPPVPPPRLSSRASLQPLNTDLSSLPPERPKTSGGFGRSPFSFSPDATSRPPLVHAHSYSAGMDAAEAMDASDATGASPASPEVSEAVTPVSPPAIIDDMNWPLAAGPSVSTATATFDILPGVPEEEEHVYNARNSMRRSRMSVASNASSLRKSFSLPMLQQFAAPMPMVTPAPSTTATGAQRPPSAASDTLGRLDIYAAQRTLREMVHGAGGGSGCDGGDDNDDAAGGDAQANWEDDIDYCYEHEIEADCEYAWDRPSMDLSRNNDDGDDRPSAATADGSRLHRHHPFHPYHLPGHHARTHKTTALGADDYVSSRLLSPGSFDLPALSPASQASTASTSEAATPTMPTITAMPTMTMPTMVMTATQTGLAMRRPAGLTIRTGISDDELRPVAPQRFLHARTSSRASSLLDLNGFNLSPSLFIPGSEKYEQSRPAAARRSPVGFAIGADDDDDDMLPIYVEPTLSMDKSMLFIPARTSASTMASAESRDSVLSDRHISATSTATDLTRLTMSTASIEDLMYKKDQEIAQI